MEDWALGILISLTGIAIILYSGLQEIKELLKEILEKLDK